MKYLGKNNSKLNVHCSVFDVMLQTSEAKILLHLSIWYNGIRGGGVQLLTTAVTK